jgi:hypothetical protein
LAFSGRRRDLNLSTTIPTFEKALSEGAEEAGIARNFLASLAKFGKRS